MERKLIAPEDTLLATQMFAAFYKNQNCCTHTWKCPPFFLDHPPRREALRQTDDPYLLTITY